MFYSWTYTTGEESCFCLEVDSGQCLFLLHPGPWFNITMSSCQYRKYHCGEKTVVRFPILVRCHLYIESGTRLSWHVLFRIRSPSVAHLPGPPTCHCVEGSFMAYWINLCGIEQRVLGSRPTLRTWSLIVIECWWLGAHNWGLANYDVT